MQLGGRQKESGNCKMMKIGNRVFDTKHDIYLMGILNVTPDSFSDGGRFNNPDAALKHVKEMIADGASIIDVGGESTRPGHTVISIEEEIARVVPVIRAIKKQYDIPVSIDTYKPEVAKAAILAGADLVNDIWGLKYDPRMAGIIAKYHAACCLMHNRKTPEYKDYMTDLLSDLKETLQIAKKAGIPDEKIMLDPGVGFGKTYEQNLIVINELEKISALGYPVLLGTSRKSVIGMTLDLPAEQRVVGTAVTSVFGVIKGCAFYRVHDCRENMQAIRMARAILTGGKTDADMQS